MDTWNCIKVDAAIGFGLDPKNNSNSKIENGVECDLKVIYHVKLRKKRSFRLYSPAFSTISINFPVSPCLIRVIRKGDCLSPQHRHKSRLKTPTIQCAILIESLFCELFLIFWAVTTLCRFATDICAADFVQRIFGINQGQIELNKK